MREKKTCDCETLKERHWIADCGLQMNTERKGKTGKEKKQRSEFPNLVVIKYT